MSNTDSVRVPHASLLVGGTEENARELAAFVNCLSDKRRPCGVHQTDGEAASLMRTAASGDMPPASPLLSVDYLTQYTSLSPGTGICSSCRKMLEHNHPDVITFDCAGAKIDQMRALAADTLTRPNESRFKVYILLGAHELSPACQNALLKPLEDPPDGVMFILTAERADSLLPTLLSRLTRRNVCISEENVSGGAANEILAAYDSRNELNILLSVLGNEKLSREDMSALIDELRRGLLERRSVEAVERLGELQLTLERNAGIGHICGAIAVILSNGADEFD